MLDEKQIALAKKLQALAERGEGGEKTTAAKKLQKMLDENGITSLSELTEDKREYTLFSYNGKAEEKLLYQVFYKVLGHNSDRTSYRTQGKRQKIGIYCTRAEKIEIELEFEFYRNILQNEIMDFVAAFIQAQGIFPDDAPEGDDEFTERDLKIGLMAAGIEKKTRHQMIEQKER